jgi:hypothetical protein
MQPALVAALLGQARRQGGLKVSTGERASRRSVIKMETLGKLLSPLGLAVSRYPYVCVLVCAAMAVLAAVAHWGHLLAVFTCAASMIVMWKDEMEHPAPALEDPATS